MKLRTFGAAGFAALVLLAACGDKEPVQTPADALITLPPDVQLPSTEQIEAEAAVEPENADDAFEALKKDIEEDS